jgi:hypothetical protein
MTNPTMNTSKNANLEKLNVFRLTRRTGAAAVVFRERSRAAAASKSMSFCVRRSSTFLLMRDTPSRLESAMVGLPLFFTIFRRANLSDANKQQE